MNAFTIADRVIRSGFLALACLAVSGCEYDVPIAAQPTQNVDSRLCGQWVAADSWMKVQPYDDAHYVVNFDGKLHRAWHTTVGSVPLVSVQNIESAERKYAFLAWQLSEDGNHLTLRVVNDNLVPDGTSDSATIQRLIAEHAANPDLLGKPILYTRQ